jgi:integrase
VALTTAYAAGLRASDAVSLNVADIDSARMVLQVRHAKGAKERMVMFSAALLSRSGSPTLSAVRLPQSDCRSQKGPRRRIRDCRHHTVNPSQG